MSSLEESLEAAIAHGTIPGAVLMATNSTGSFNYCRTFGLRSLEDGHREPLESDDVMAIFSCTKLLTTIAVLQVVELGLIHLDDDIINVLPELSKLPILTGMDDGKPVLNSRQNPITLRHLLTHTSGLVYMTPLIQEYNRSIGLPDPGPFGPPWTTVIESFSSPLIFEPGTSWRYGPGLDWAGLAVARLMHTDLETFFQKHIFTPLQIDDMTFWPERKPHLLPQMVGMSLRDPSMASEQAALLSLPVNIQEDVQEEFGGQGLYASMPSFLIILRSLLVDDEKLLRKETTAQMFEPQLTSSSQAVLQADFDNIGTPHCIGSYVGEYPKMRYDWGLGGLLAMEDVNENGHFWRRKGCLMWSGMPNLFWFVDRTARLCGVYGSQVIPPGDTQVNTVIGLFDKTMYKRSSL